MPAVLFCAAGWAQGVTIANSGSTNTAPFQITVEKSGRARYMSQPRPPQIARGETAKKIRKKISKSLAQRLYSDVKAAQPLSSLPQQHCPKSASFGTRLTIQAGGEESPDLSCGDGGDAKLRALIRDVDQIVNLFRQK